MNRGRKITGGKYHKFRKTRLSERRGQERAVVLGETKIKQIRLRGGNIRSVLLKSNTVNILNEKKVEKAQIVNVEETPQNKFLARRNKLMKGAIIETSLGRAKITNRPSREGLINAILIKN